MTPERKALAERITAYLCSGGLFNPEMAIHDRVRNLLIDCRAALSADTREEARPTIPADELQELLVTMNHARTFITSREKMHPDGVKLWDGLYDRLRALAARPSAGEALPVAQETDAIRQARHESYAEGYRDGKAFARSTVEATPPARDSVIEECAKVCEMYEDRAHEASVRNPMGAGEYMTGRSQCAAECAAAIRALKEKYSMTDPVRLAAEALLSGFERHGWAATSQAAREKLIKLICDLERALAAPARDTQPVARDWMSRNVNEFAGAFNRRYEETGSLRESMMYAFVTVYDAAMASPVRQEET